MDKYSIYSDQYDSYGKNPWEGGAYTLDFPKGTDLAATLYVLKPGATTGYYHFHHGNEEMAVLIEGRPTLRTPEGCRVLAAGEVVHFGKGPESAHQIINETEQTVRLLFISHQVSPDAVEYPDHGLLSVMAFTDSQLGQPLWDMRPITREDSDEADGSAGTDAE